MTSSVEAEFARTVELLKKHTIKEVATLLEVSKSCVVKRQRVYWQRVADPTAHAEYRKQRLAVCGSRVMNRSRSFAQLTHQESAPDALDLRLSEQARHNKCLLKEKISNLLLRGKVEDARFRAAGNPELELLVKNYI